MGKLCGLQGKVNKCPTLLMPCSSPGSVDPTFPSVHDSAQPSNLPIAPSKFLQCLEPNMFKWDFTEYLFGPRSSL